MSKVGEVQNFITKNLRIILALAIVLSNLLSVLILGTNSVIGVHDTFDSNLIWYKILADSGMVFAPSEAIVPGYMGGLPRLSFGTEFYLLFWFIALFGVWGGYVLNLVSMHIVGFFGMYFLLKKHFLKDSEYDFICLGIAICFAILPVYPPSGLSVASLPLALYAMLNIKSGEASKIDWLLLIIIPFYSSLVYSYFFYLSGIGIYWLIDTLRNRKINLHFFSSIVVMVGVFLIVEYRILLDMLFTNWFVSHRVEQGLNSLTLEQSLRLVWTNFLEGHYHAASFQYPIIIISIGIALLLLFLSLIPRTRIIIADNKELLSSIVGISIAIVAASIWFGLWQLYIWVPIKMEISLFRTFQFDRYYWIQPLLWYVAFALSLSVIRKGFGEYKPRKIPISHIIIITLVILQLGIVFPTSWETVSRQPESVTFKEFYAIDQFAQIRDDIGLPQESYNVISIGLHPVIAKYNGFYTLDGYSWNYPLEYKHRFRNIIVYELEKNEVLRAYFDEWGNRCYAFIDGLDPSKLYRKENPVTLNNVQLNSTALDELQCSYIFSAVNVSNYASNNLQLLHVYEHEDSAWRIFLYEVQ